MKRRRYTDEELSRVLGEHAARCLITGGTFAWVRFGYAGSFGCANQVAFNEPVENAAFREAKRIAIWFDKNYRTDMSPEELLHGLESHQ